MTELAHRLDVDLAGAMEIASLARAPGVKLTEAARLIEQYARTKASEAKLDAILEVSDRICSSFEAPLARKEPTNA